MKTSTLLVIALESELQEVAEHAAMDILYCGVGKINATYHLTRKLTEAKLAGRPFSKVVNFGSAGSHRFPKGSLVAASEFIQRDMDVTALGFTLGETPFDPVASRISFAPQLLHLEHGICASGDSFVACTDKDCEIIDMEAYALAKVCALEGIPFVCVKYITDGGDGDASTDWQTNVHATAQRFSEILQHL